MKSKTLLALLLFTSLFCGASEIDCSKASTTNEINVCKHKELDKSEALLKKYLKASKNHYKDEDEVIALINKSQEKWLSYRESHCDAIYKIWEGGTIRGVMHGQCMVDVTKNRTYELWKSYLTFMDSTPPL